MEGETLRLWFDWIGVGNFADGCPQVLCDWRLGVAPVCACVGVWSVGPCSSFLFLPSILKLFFMPCAHPQNYVTVYDGTGGSNTTLEQICGVFVPENSEVTTSGTSVVVVLHVEDFNLFLSGFGAQFEITHAGA